jgi:hypothetical protein
MGSFTGIGNVSLPNLTVADALHGQHLPNVGKVTPVGYEPKPLRNSGQGLSVNTLVFWFTFEKTDRGGVRR